MADYNPNYMASIGRGRNLDADMSVGAIRTGKTYKGSDSAVTGGFSYNDDRPTGLASRPQQTTTQEDDKPSFWDRITSLFEQNEVDVTNVYQPSVNPAAVYDGSAFQVDDVSDYVYRAEMSDQTQDMVEQAMGYEKPQLGQLQLLDTRAMTEKEKERLGPLINLADDIRNQNITTTELPPIEGEEQSSLMDALMEGQPTAGLMSRPSSFTGGSVQVASNIPDWMAELSAAEMVDALVGIKEGTVDPETGQQIQSEDDVAASTAMPDVAPEINTTPPTSTEDEDLVGDEPVVRDNSKVFGWKGRNGPTSEQSEAFNRLRDAAVAKGILGDELRQLLAQAAVESAWYTATVEGDGGSASNISGGSDYLGRGPLQLTHDYNYRDFGESKGVGDLYVEQPELLADPDLGTEASLWYWENYVQPKVSDFTDTYAVSGAINRGDPKKKALHLKDRKQAFQAIRLRDVGVRPMLRPE